jgi:hypothetical protein
VQAIQELANRANQGSENALACLRQVLDTCPEIWQAVGDLASHTERCWLDLIAGNNRLMEESVKRQVATMRAELSGPSPSPVERLLVDRVVACHLALHDAEACLASPGTASTAQVAIRLRRVESAQRRLLAALKTLTRLRALLPAGMTTSNSQRLAGAGR